MFELVKTESGLGITVLHISSILSRQLLQYKMNKPISWMSVSVQPMEMSIAKGPDQL